MRSRRPTLSFAFALIAGCHGNDASNGHDASPVASAVPVASVAPPHRAPRQPTASDPRAHDLDGLVRAWNAAINAHDASQLDALYAGSIELYGTRMPHARALVAKKGSFAKHAKDELSAIAVSGSGHIQFQKKSTARDGHVLEVTGYLDAEQTDGKWLIVAEGDTTTDANLARAKESRCEDAVLTLVMATTEAKEAIRDIEEGAKKAPADDPVNPAVMVLPRDRVDPTWSVAICENHADRMPCMYHFDVDPSRGSVREFDDPHGRVLDTDPAPAAKVREACK
jgi:hypothetical protein